jgi:hypothetical protein
VAAALEPTGPVHRVHEVEAEPGEAVAGLLEAVGLRIGVWKLEAR